MKSGLGARSRTVFLSTTVVLTAGLLTAAPIEPAKAQSSERRQVYSFNIPAKPVRQALNDISRITGVSVVFRETAAASISGNAVSGTMSRDQALVRLLAGTGLSYSFTNANTITITNRLTQAFSAPDDGSVLLDPIELVSSGSSRPGGSAWQQASEEIYRTPASVANVNAGTINSFGNDLNNSLRSVSGVSTYQDAAQPGMAVNVRGLEGFGRVTSTIDGVRQNYRFVAHAPAGYTYVEPSLLGGIDITKGAITTAGGAGTLSGAVNYRTLAIDDVLNSDERAGAQVTTTFGGNRKDDVAITKSGGVRFNLPGAPDGGSVFGAVNMTSAANYENGDGKVVNNSWREVKSGLL